MNTIIYKTPGNPEQNKNPRPAAQRRQTEGICVIMKFSVSSLQCIT